VVAACRLLVADVFLEPRRLFARELAGEPKDDQTLQSAPHLEDVARFLPSGLGHGGAAVAPEFYQALGRKLTQRMPYQCAADPEAFADRVFRKLGPRLQGLLDDGVTQRAVDGGGAITGNLRRMLGHASRQSF